MIVFVWVTHGDSSVYDITTVEQRKNLLDELKSVFEGYDEEVNVSDDDCDDVNRYINRMNDFLFDIIRFGDDNFEYGTGFCKVR